MMLEQHYETDSVLLALAGQKAQIFQRYGINEVTDELLDRKLTLSVNVGMGATDPVMKLQRFVYAVMSFANIAKAPPPGMDLKEIAKEMFGLSGYQDGTRFMIEGQDPEVVKLLQQNKQLMMQLQQLNIQLKNKEGANVVKLQTVRESNQAKLQQTREGNATKVTVEELRQGQQSKELLAQHIMDLEQQGVNHSYAMEAARQAHLYAQQASGQPPHA
jgi:hypothetical protein